MTAGRSRVGVDRRNVVGSCECKVLTQKSGCETSRSLRLGWLAGAGSEAQVRYGSTRDQEGPGAVLVAGRYRMVSRLGRGGMGEVWRAVDEQLGRSVAVKLLLNHRASEAAVTRFHLEARTAAQLNDPHVVAVYDIGTEQGRQYLVTELLEGPSLAEELARHGPFSGQRTTMIGEQIAAGLAAAHHVGVVHRDIKPANLLLDPDGAVKIGDFGIARFADESTAGLTAAGQVVGTSTYLAPERALGEPSGPPADMYALGCVLYELLAGHPPFQADTPAGRVYQHIGIAPEPLSRHRSDVPDGLGTLVLSLLAKNPGDRPTAQQAADFMASPELWATGQPYSDETVRRTAPAPVLAPPRPRPTPEKTGQARDADMSRPSRPRRTRMVAGSVVAAAVVAGLSVMPYIVEGRGPSDTTQPSPTHSTRHSTRGVSGTSKSVGGTRAPATVSSPSASASAKAPEPTASAKNEPAPVKKTKAEKTLPPRKSPSASPANSSPPTQPSTPTKKPSHSAKPKKPKKPEN